MRGNHCLTCAEVRWPHERLSRRKLKKRKARSALARQASLSFLRLLSLFAAILFVAHRPRGFGPGSRRQIAARRSSIGMHSRGIRGLPAWDGEWPTEVRAGEMLRGGGYR